jgi:hypothetical protein
MISLKISGGKATFYVLLVFIKNFLCIPFPLTLSLSLSVSEEREHFIGLHIQISL